MREARAEIERGDERIAAMREERAALGKLQRGRRAAVDQDIARQEEAIERWSMQAETAVPPAAPPTALTSDIAPAQFDVDEMRVAALDPDAALRRVLGIRPSSFRARDAWTREAIALVGRGTPALDPSPEPASIDDVGLDL